MRPTFIALMALCLCLPLMGAEKKAGTRLWEFKTEGRVTDSPAIGSNGTVYIGASLKGAIRSAKVKMYALNGKTGAKKWEFETEGLNIYSPILGSDGTLYLVSANLFVTSFNKVYSIRTSSKGPAKSPWPMFGQNARHTGRAK